MINTGALIHFLRARLGEDVARTTSKQARAILERRLALVAEFEGLLHNEGRMSNPLLQARYEWLLKESMLGMARRYRQHPEFDEGWRE